MEFEITIERDNKLEYLSEGYIVMKCDTCGERIKINLKGAEFDKSITPCINKIITLPAMVK